MPYVDDFTENLMIQIIARDVAKGVEMARSLGHKMPTAYDVGVRLDRNDKFMPEPGAVPYLIRIRMDDAVVWSSVQLPDVLTNGSLQRQSDLLEAAWRRIHQDAMTVPHAWLHRHPEATGDPQDGLKRLAALDSDEATAAWMRSCEEISKKLTYRRAR